MTRSLVALGVFAAAAPACPPRWVVWYTPPVVWAVPCCPAAVAPTPPKAAAVPAAPPTVMGEGVPKPPPRVEPEASPFRPAGDKQPDPLVLPKMDVPAAPPPTPKPADPKGLELKPVSPGVTPPDLPPLPLTVPKESKTSFRLPDPGPGVRLVPAAGPPPADARRRVVFVNLTGSAVRLTVDGESATLPARHELTAAVGVRFRWRLGDGESRTDEVPAAAAGLDVLIR